MSRSPSKTGKKGREMGTRGAKIVNTLIFNYFSETFYYYILILLFCKFRWCNSGEIFIFVCIPLISVHLLVYILYLHAKGFTPGFYSVGVLFDGVLLLVYFGWCTFVGVIFSDVGYT